MLPTHSSSRSHRCTRKTQPVCNLFALTYSFKPLNVCLISSVKIREIDKIERRFVKQPSRRKLKWHGSWYTYRHLIIAPHFIPPLSLSVTDRIGNFQVALCCKSFPGKVVSFLHEWKLYSFSLPSTGMPIITQNQRPRPSSLLEGGFRRHATAITRSNRTAS